MCIFIFSLVINGHVAINKNKDINKYPRHVYFWHLWRLVSRSAPITTMVIGAVYWGVPAMLKGDENVQILLNKPGDRKQPNSILGFIGEHLTSKQLVECDSVEWADIYDRVSTLRRLTEKEMERITFPKKYFWETRRKLNIEEFDLFYRENFYLDEYNRLHTRIPVPSIKESITAILLCPSSTELWREGIVSLSEQFSEFNKQQAICSDNGTALSSEYQPYLFLDLSAMEQDNLIGQVNEHISVLEARNIIIKRVRGCNLSEGSIDDPFAEGCANEVELQHLYNIRINARTIREDFN
jgi:hypothetical protein